MYLAVHTKKQKQKTTYTHTKKKHIQKAKPAFYFLPRFLVAASLFKNFLELQYRIIFSLNVHICSHVKSHK